MANNQFTGLDQQQKEFMRLIRDNAHRHHLHEVFRDFCELAAISLSNAVDLAHRAAREARYMNIVKRYTKEEVYRFPQMLGALVGSLEIKAHDALGALFMSLDLGAHWGGQFFTPDHLAALCARATLGDIAAEVQERGFITVSEPACGAGAMVIAMADAIRETGVNYQQAMHVTAIDIDATCVHMAYIQFSLLNIPAMVILGNTISGECREVWYTPAHILGFWSAKLRRRVEVSAPASEAVAEMFVPTRRDGPSAAGASPQMGLFD